MSSWTDHNLETQEINVNKKQSKIRKRGCSSSSSSSLVQKYRFKRAIFAGKRGGMTTPVPIWNTSTRSPSMARNHKQLSTNLPFSGVALSDKELSVSARKLAATLWEFSNVPSSKVNEDFEVLKDVKKEMRNKDDKARNFSKSRWLIRHMSDPSYTPGSERTNGIGIGDCRRKESPVPQKIQPNDYCMRGEMDVVRSNCLTEKQNHSGGQTGGKCVNAARNRLKEARRGIATSKKLLDLLNNIYVNEGQDSTSIDLISTLGSELGRICDHVDHSIREQKLKQNEFDYLLKCFVEEKAVWKRRQRERIRDAIASISEELEVEKKLRRQTERLNKKIGYELADAKVSVQKMTKELEREKRAKEILEQICDELARGIGEDRAQAEELRRESAKVREEVEKEREMLQLADVLREERVQMKLSEAKYEFEEKNAIVEKLRNELEGCLKTKAGSENSDLSPEFKKIKELEAYLKKIHFGSYNAAKEERLRDAGGGEGHEEEEEEDSGESDLHSIELNMDNSSRIYSWSFTKGDDDAQENSRRPSTDRETTGRKSISDKIQWRNICFKKSTSNKSQKTRENSDLQDRDRHYDQPSPTQTPEQGVSTEKYGSSTDLKERIPYDSSLSVVENLDNPKKRSNQLLLLQDLDCECWEGSLILQGDTLKHVEAGPTTKFDTLNNSVQ